LNGIQEVASSILVSSTTERTLIPLVFEPTSGLLIFTPITFPPWRATFSLDFEHFPIMSPRQAQAPPIDFLSRRR
jgi:hypothetical protein